MKQTAYLVLVGGAAYLIFLLLTFPARLAFAWFLPDTIRGFGVEGTVWHGEARILIVNDIPFSAASWRFMPTSLFTLKAGYQVEAERPDGFLRARLSVSPFGTVAIRDLQAALPLAWLERTLPLSGVTGNLSARLDTVQIEEDWPVRLNGQINLDGLIVSTPSRQSLGSYSLTFENQKSDPITGRFSDVEGPLDVEGVLTLRYDRTYFVEGLAAARPEANDDLRNMLQFIGPPAQGGAGHSFSLEGEL